MNPKEQLNKTGLVIPGQAIYFIGIGGIGMSALARHFHSIGAVVSGYDRAPTPLCTLLEQEGIAIHYEERVDLVPQDPAWIIYTPAIPASHAELAYCRKQGYRVIKRSDALEMITDSTYNICVSGTHGKTTTTTMIAHLLRDTGYGCTAFLGGISANYHTNFWNDGNDVIVVEADEYDRSFLKLSPDIAVITSMDADHLDIYGDTTHLEQAFIDFSGRLRAGGTLISKYGLKRGAELKGEHHITYALDALQADVHAANIRVENGSYLFDIKSHDWEIHDVCLHMGGLHNIENAVAAITAARILQQDTERIKKAVATFRGVGRRFEYIVKTKDHVLIDDYAHHPRELEALISGVRSLFGDRKLTIVFQPHLFSRTKDLSEDFAASLDLADEVILLPIYPARELPVEGVNSRLIADRMKTADVHEMDKTELERWVREKRPSLLVMAGAGDIDALVPVMKKIMND